MHNSRSYSTAYVMCREFRRRVRHGFGPATETCSSWSQQGRQAGRPAKFYDPGLTRHSSVPSSDFCENTRVNCSSSGQTEAPSLFQWTGGLVSVTSLHDRYSRSGFRTVAVCLKLVKLQSSRIVLYLRLRVVLPPVPEF